MQHVFLHLSTPSCHSGQRNLEWKLSSMTYHIIASKEQSKFSAKLKIFIDLIKNICGERKT